MGKSTNRIVMIVLFLGTILASYTHCLGPVQSKKNNLSYNGTDNSSNPSTGNNPVNQNNSDDKAISVQAFAQTVHPLTQARCVSCHGSFQQPLHAVSDATQAHDAVVDGFKVNFDNIPSSRLVAKLRDESHNCWSSNCDSDADEMASAINDWKDILEQNGGSTETETPSSALVTGESLTLDQELDPDRAMSTGTILMEASSATLAAPMVLNGNYIHVPNNGNTNNNANSTTAGIAHFYFDTNMTASYKIFALVNAPSNNDNSFWVRTNNGNYAQWHIPQTTGFEWREVTNTANNNPFDFFLPAGNGHRLEVKQREDGTQLSQIVISDDPNINLNDVNGALVVTVSFDISSLVGSPATFTIDVQEYDAYSYKLSNPTIISSRPLRIKSIKPLLNGNYNPQHATYTLIDTITTPGTSLLSERALLALKDQGVTIDRLSFSFEVLQAN